MSLQLICSCGEPVEGATGRDLYAAAVAHIEACHRELLDRGDGPVAADNVAQLDDEPTAARS